MKPNRSIELSQGLYRQLLRLYPQTYRATYETEMFHVFTDQCREAYQGRGGLGLISLWLRTLMDVGKTVVVEHVSAPNASVGLLEAMPNAPLPWKGVLLVLIPGLIFFISQIEQVTSDKDWFFLVYYLAAFFLIVPVVLTWTFARRFPIWGLIPLGLLYATLLNYRSTYPALIEKWFSIRRSYHLIKLFQLAIDPYYILPLLVMLVLLVGLILYYTRAHEMTKPVSRWLFLYVVLIAIQILGETYRTLSWQASSLHLDAQNLGRAIFQVSFEYLYVPLALLLLVFVGKLFARRHGGLSFLLLLGYLLPTIVFGRYGEWTDVIPFYIVTSAVLIYRFVVALVAPVWLVRAASVPGRQRAAAIPVAVAILCHIALNLTTYLAWAASPSGFPISLLDVALSIWNQLIIAAGLGLAVALYLPKEEDTAVVSPPLEVVTE